MKLKLESKHLFYSLFLAGSMLLFLIGYFIYMLPSLYVDYLMDENLKAIRQQHRTFVDTESYENARVKNPTACFSLRIPNQGNVFLLAGKSFSLRLTVTDDRLLEEMRNLQTVFGDFHAQEEEGDTAETSSLQMQGSMEQCILILKKAFPSFDSLPVELELIEHPNTDSLYVNEYIRYHPVSEQFIILETGVEDANNRYTNYIAIEKLEDSLVFSFLPVMTPDIHEIRPVILQSLPFLITAVLFLVLIFSRIYAKGIISPAQQLILQSYEELKEKNRELEEENLRQEIFLRASSHQLKTPISAALLLADGMIGKVGKYADRNLYLPKMKEQLLSMRKITDDILYWNRLKEQVQIQEIDLDTLLKSCLSSYRIIISNRNLTLTSSQGLSGKAFTDERITSLILDNLLSNAVNYTPAGNKIEIRTFPGMIQIQNYGIRIPDKLLPHIFEPFVSGNHGPDGHGLGLYLASYYAPVANASLSVTNEDESVLAILSFNHYRKEN